MHCSGSPLIVVLIQDEGIPCPGSLFAGPGIVLGGRERSGCYQREGMPHGLLEGGESGRAGRERGGGGRLKRARLTGVTPDQVRPQLVKYLCSLVDDRKMMKHFTCIFEICFVGEGEKRREREKERKRERGRKRERRRVCERERERK